MFKVYIILVGLIGVVPSPDGKSVRAILLKTDGQQTALGTPLVAHEPKVRFRSRSRGLVTLPLTGDLSFAPDGAQANFVMNLRDRDRLPQIGRLLHQRTVTVKPGCTGNNPGAGCRFNDLPLVAARVQLTGGWTLKPIEVEGGDPCLCEEPVPLPTARDRSVWGFRPANELHLEDGRENEFTNGFQFTIYLPDLNSLHISGGGGLDLVSSPAADCTSLDPSAPNCAIVTVRNIGRCEHAVDCDHPRAGTHDDSDDTHFELLYALLDPVPAAAQRLIPFRKTKHIPRIGGPGNPPGSKCFGGFIP